MIVFRLSKLKYSKDLSGKGSELSGGRWNSRGRAMLYTSATRALCTAEIAVHTPLGNLPDDYVLISIEIPDTIIVQSVDANKLSGGWKSFPHPNFTKLLGDKFIAEEKRLVLKAPSAVVMGECNFLINPNHKDFHKIKIIKIESFVFQEKYPTKKQGKIKKA